MEDILATFSSQPTDIPFKPTLSIPGKKNRYTLEENRVDPIFKKGIPSKHNGYTLSPKEHIDEIYIPIGPVIKKL